MQNNFSFLISIKALVLKKNKIIVLSIFIMDIMIPQVKVGNTSMRTWGVILLICQVFLISMMIGTLCSRHWVYTSFRLY